ncbi:MAG: hypothetical protein PHH11_11710 [Methylomonas sp.]|nr:hypothetical protein [Methylomonas sp.]
MSNRPHYRGANKIRQKLGWQPGIANPPEGKPKGMHWRTYHELMRRQLTYANHAYAGMVATLKKVDVRFAEITRNLNI